MNLETISERLVLMSRFLRKMLLFQAMLQRKMSVGLLTIVIYMLL